MYMCSLLIVLCFVALDVVTGLTGALKNKDYMSSVMREGLFHKLGEVMAIAFGYCCELSFPYLDIDINIPVVHSIMIYIVIMEIGSIIENLCIISPELKEILQKVFGSYRKKG